MQVRVDTLNSAQLCLKETTGAVEWDLGSPYLDFVDEVALACAISKIENVVTIKADVGYTERVTCARCLQEIERAGKKTYTIYVDDPAPEALIDVSSLVREELLLEYPLKTLCSEACKGICNGCGRNLNSEACVCTKP